jgi:hypothetical protein
MAALEDLSGTLDAALEISARRAQSLRQLREALESNDDALALSIARKVCGLNDQTMLRAVESINGRTSDRR